MSTQLVVVQQNSRFREELPPAFRPNASPRARTSAADKPLDIPVPDRRHRVSYSSGAGRRFRLQLGPQRQNACREDAPRPEGPRPSRLRSVFRRYGQRNDRCCQGNQLFRNVGSEIKTLSWIAHPCVNSVNRTATAQADRKISALLNDVDIDVSYIRKPRLPDNGLRQKPPTFLWHAILYPKIRGLGQTCR